MSATINENGISIETLEELYIYLQTNYKTIYGQDINLDSDTTDGQFMAFLSKLVRDMQENAVSTYNAFDPDLAENTQLIRLLKFCGIVKRPATKSSVDIEITVDRSVNLPTKYTVSDTLNQNWIITSPITLPTGTHTLSFLAENWGSVEALPNTIINQNTIVLGVTSVTNPNEALVGRDDETDTQLRQRRKQSVSLPSENRVDGLQAKLLNVSGVIDAVVLENKTLNYDSTLDLNGKTIWAIIEGGSVEDIGTTISLDRGTGVELKGNVTYSYQRQQLRQNGTFRIFTDLARFDRPVNTEIYIKFDVTLRSGSITYDLTSIKNALLEKLYDIGENATVTELYGYIYNAGNTFIATNLQLSKDDITFSGDLLTANADEKFIIDFDKITITEV